MRRPAVRVIALIALATAALAVPAFPPAEPAGAQPETDRSGYGPDANLAVNTSDGLNDTELEAVVSRTMVRVETIRGVSFEQRPQVTVVSREEFQAQYGGLPSNLSEDRTAFRNAKYRALFLVGDETNATAARAANRNASVAGFYAPSTGEIVVVSGSDGEQPLINEPVLAHELFHAYQDQRWGLAGYDDPTTDGRHAELGLIEGDATYLESLYQRRCESDWNCITPAEAEAGASGGDRSARPGNMGLLLLSYQPYDDGPAFIEAVRERGGWAAVNALYADPPASAEQVIRPEAYPDETPRETRLDDASSEGWDRIELEGRPNYDRLGMAAIGTMFVDPLYEGGGEEWIVSSEEWFTYRGQDPPAYDTLNYGVSYATGWEGDRFYAYEHDEEVGYVWRLAWESSGETETFLDGFDELVVYRGAQQVANDTYVIEEGGYDGAYHVAVEGNTATITHAPTTDALTAVRAGAEPGTAARTIGDDAAAPRAGGERPIGAWGVLVAALVVGALVLAYRRYG